MIEKKQIQMTMNEIRFLKIQQFNKYFKIAIKAETSPKIEKVRETRTEKITKKYRLDEQKKEGKLRKEGFIFCASQLPSLMNC